MPITDPTDIANLAHWYDASDASSMWQSADGTGAVTANGDPVGRWDDKSGGARHISQATTSAKPTYATNALNSKSVLTLDGGDVMNGSGDGLGSARTYFVVWKADSLANNPAIAEWYSAVRNFFQILTAGTHKFFNGTGTNELTGGTYTAGTWIVMEGWHETLGGTQELYVDGTLMESDPSGDSFATHTSVIMGDDSTGGNRVSGGVAEIIVYAAALTSTQRTDVRDYLDAKWFTAGGGDLTVSVSDTTTLSESVSATVSDSQISVTDSAAVSESATVSIQTEISVSDSTNVAESVGTVISTSAVVVTDTATVTESVTTNLTSFIDVADSASVAEAVTEELVSAIGVSDSIAISESVAVGIEIRPAVGDSASLSESVTSSVSDPEISIGDNAAVTESVAISIVVVGQIEVSATDSAAVSESVTISVQTLVQASDSTNITESVGTVASSPAIVRADSATVAEMVTAILVSVVDVSDNVAVAESVAALLSDQYARATSDIAAGSWTTQVGATTNLFAVLDEESADDADYIQSSLTPSTDAVRLGLNGLVDPSVSSGHIVRYRYRKDSADAGQVDLVVRLFESATERASWTHTNVGASWTTASQTLSNTEANSITDYAALRIEFEANQP